MSIGEALSSEDADYVFSQDATPITNDANEPPQFLDVPNGTCRVCGKPASSKYGKYCTEHKGMYDKRKTRHQKGGDSAPRESVKRKSSKDLKADLTASFTMAGMFWSMAPPRVNPEDLRVLFPELNDVELASIRHPGAVLTEQAEVMAESFTKLADQNPRIAKWLEAASQPNGYIGVIMATLPVANAAYAWHKIVVPRVRQYNAEHADAGA